MRPVFHADARPEPAEIFEQIDPKMAELKASSDCDENRPLIKFYRSRDEIDLLVPARA
jgi:hypothetical protein